jgi:hypothetical protein
MIAMITELELHAAGCLAPRKKQFGNPIYKMVPLVAQITANRVQVSRWRVESETGAAAI